MRFPLFKTPKARGNRKFVISVHAKLANELGKKLRVSITAASKPAKLRSAAR